MKKQTERGEDGIVKVKPKRGYPPMRNGCVNEGAGGVEIRPKPCHIWLCHLLQVP